MKVKNEAGKTFNRIDLDVDTGDGHIIIQNYKRGGFGITVDKLSPVKNAAQIQEMKDDAESNINMNTRLQWFVDARLNLAVGFQKEWGLRNSREEKALTNQVSLVY